MFTVYTKPACPWCDRAKDLLKSKGLPFETVNLDVGQPKSESEQYVSREELLSKIPTARTMPQILQNNRVIGGYQELVAVLK